VKIADRFVSTDLELLGRYFAEPGNRARTWDRLASKISPDTRVLIGHSFGSVVAYEALSRHPEWPVHTLVTVGSPLGLPKLVTRRLDPAPDPLADRLPGSVERWVNVSDPEDIVALFPRLAPAFGPRVEDFLVDNGPRRHALSRYMEWAETSHAVTAALCQPELSELTGAAA